MKQSTALGAKGNKLATPITFKSKEHEKFYYECLQKCRCTDVYHKALVYTLEISRDTRFICLQQSYDIKLNIRTNGGTDIRNSC